MPRYIAFLRAINVGGRVVSMADLRGHFEALGFDDVSTFIASGNVIFRSRSSAGAALERKIARRLRDGLGYDVDTFLRTDADVHAIAVYQAFPPAQRQAAAALNVGLLATPLTAAQTAMLMGLRSDLDDFHVNGREVYWLSKARQSESKFSGAVLERKLSTRVTFRGVNTIERLAARYPPTENP